MILGHIRKVYGVSEDFEYFYPDNLGSRRVVLNNAGTVTDKFTYSAYGEVTHVSGSNLYLASFTGKEYDAAGLIYFNARYYDSKVGRFITEDPSAQGTSWYSYCGNNPINAVDPDGREINYKGETYSSGTTYSSSSSSSDDGSDDDNEDNRDGFFESVDNFFSRFCGALFGLDKYDYVLTMRQELIPMSGMDPDSPAAETSDILRRGAWMIIADLLGNAFAKIPGGLQYADDAAKGSGSRFPREPIDIHPGNREALSIDPSMQKLIDSATKSPTPYLDASSRRLQRDALETMLKAKGLSMQHIGEAEANFLKIHAQVRIENILKQGMSRYRPYNYVLNQMHERLSGNPTGREVAFITDTLDTLYYRSMKTMELILTQGFRK